MNCHSQIWADSPKLEPVRASFRTGESIAWLRVHDLPDFVYFDHSIHVQKGVACVSCHGRVDRMPLMWREYSLHMQWCLDCHRNPEPYMGRREEVFAMSWSPPDIKGETLALGAEHHEGARATNCSVCHR